MICGTEKFYNEEAQTSAYIYEQQSTTSNTSRLIRQMMHES